jgi:16S rRNA (uracil1498-N3)-methyltransferase
MGIPAGKKDGVLTMPRFMLAELSGTRGVILGEDARHLARVHRSRVGDALEVTHQGRAFRALIVTLASGHVEVDLINELPDPEPPVHVELFLGLIKADKFELAIQKAVEIGVSAVQPVHCTRSITPLQNIEGKRDRWQRIAQEASKQCGRTLIPEVREPDYLSRSLRGSQAALRLVAYEGGGMDLTTALNQCGKVESVALLIGPEGGFTEGEISLAREQGFLPVTLGPRILRAETAALVLLTSVLYHLADIGGKTCPPSPSSPWGAR